MAPSVIPNDEIFLEIYTHIPRNLRREGTFQRWVSLLLKQRPSRGHFHSQSSTSQDYPRLSRALRCYARSLRLPIVM